MGQKLPNYLRINPFQIISSAELIARATCLMGDIDLDAASSKEANEYVQAKSFFAPKDDALNSAKWYGRVYLFPPTHTYFWHKKTKRWKMTRACSATLTSGGALWWRTLKRHWINRDVEEAIFFSNQMDMLMYCQDLFDHPMCIFKYRPRLMRLYDDGSIVEGTPTGSSFVVYLHSMDNIEQKTEKFIQIYQDKGRILV